MNGNNFKRQGETLLPAIAYGDAAGLPVETRSAEYIAEHYGEITELIPTAENPFYIGNYDPGLWSDDTQLSLAVAEALIAANGFDIEAMAEAHIKAYDATPDMERRGIQVKRGWGGSTIAAMEKLKAGVNPLESGTLDGAGNGVLMKMAPLAYWQFMRGTSEEERHWEYDQFTTMTHDSDLARLTTRIHGDVLNTLLSNPYDKEELMAKLDDMISKHEFETGQPGAIRDLLSYLHGEVNKDTILAHTDRRGFVAHQTLAMAYGAFMAHDGEFIPSVFEAVNLGGDTDSTGSIVAAMSNFATKEALRMPLDHQNLDRLTMVKRVSRKLARQAAA